MPNLLEDKFAIASAVLVLGLFWGGSYVLAGIKSAPVGAPAPQTSQNPPAPVAQVSAPGVTAPPAVHTREDEHAESRIDE